MRLYYMTSAKWAEVILKERRLKLSRFHEANDPFELNLIDSRDPSRRKIVKMIEKHHIERTGMICLGAVWDNPMIWAHYAEKHTGICLGLEVDDQLVSAVEYTNEKIDVEFGPHLPNHGLSRELLNKVLTTKSKVWESEQERRVLGELKTPDPKTGLYYTDFGSQVQLRSVIIGYRCTWTIAEVVSLLGQVVEPVRVWKVRPAFGRFAMVEQHGIKSVTIHPPKVSRK
ncbi:MAG: DUF2971 domain-containing protein [Rhodocyclaceae bacterium]|nr:DUF2971 domain-containing protein [Rhodocyclaceae bacterium]MBL0075940.1 DUF2971 domain-containing protein [Rhodocyclaceae bacterium]